MEGPPEELTLESVRNFMLFRGGRATNHELVQYFRPLLTNSENKEVARNNFKQYVNTLSNISIEDGNKYLVLKNKYRNDLSLSFDGIGNPADVPGRYIPSHLHPDHHDSSSSYGANYSPQHQAFSPNVSAEYHPYSPVQTPNNYNNTAQYAGHGSPYAEGRGQQSRPQQFMPPLQRQTSVGSDKASIGPPGHYLQHSSSSGRLPRQNSIPGDIGGSYSDYHHSHHSNALPAHNSTGPSYYGQPSDATAAPPLPPKSQHHSPYQQQNHFNGSGNNAPRFRTPPPYRPPPSMGSSSSLRQSDPNLARHMSPQGQPNYPAPSHVPNNNYPHLQQPTYPSPKPPPSVKYNSPRYDVHSGSRNSPLAGDHFSRRGSCPEDGYVDKNAMIHGSFNDPADLGIPLAPSQLHRTNSRGSNSPINIGGQPHHNMPSAHQPTRPNMLPVQPMPSLANVPPSSSYVTKVVSNDHDGEGRLLPSKVHHKGYSGAGVAPPYGQPITAQGGSATPSPVGDSSSSTSPVAPHRRPKSDKISNKENYRPPNSENSTPGSGSSAGDDSDGRAASTLSLPRGDSQEKKISVKEKTQIFNKMASETNLLNDRLKNNNKGNRSSRAERDYDDNMSILSYGQDGQDWLVAACSSDFNEILRLLKIHPSLVRWKDRCNGYTALHWAAKHGRVEVVKLLAGTHQADPNAKSNGGYTPLHLAAMYNRRDVFDLLVHYGAELNMRDYSGKKPRQYSTIPSNTISPEHDKRIIQRRHSTVKDSASFLRIGSLNVKVRRTTEAFNSLLSRDSSHEHFKNQLHKNYGSSDSLPEDRESGSGNKLMPPPIFGPMKKKKTKKDRDSSSNLFSSSSSNRPTSSPLFSTLSSSLSSSLASLSSKDSSHPPNSSLKPSSEGTTPSHSASSTPLATPSRRSSTTSTNGSSRPSSQSMPPPQHSAPSTPSASHHPLPPPAGYLMPLPPHPHHHPQPGIPPFHGPSPHLPPPPLQPLVPNTYPGPPPLNYHPGPHQLLQHAQLTGRPDRHQDDSDSDNACGFGSNWR